MINTNPTRSAIINSDDSFMMCHVQNTVIILKYVKNFEAKGSILDRTECAENNCRGTIT
jgi:hypothetical protein